MSSPVDRYLAELGRALPRAVRRRVVAEAEDHLRASALAHGEEEALARFGSARELARSFARAAAIRETRRAALLLAAALVPAAGASYPLPHDLLPPWGSAPLDHWPEAAFDVGLRQDAILLLLLVTPALVAAGIVAAVTRRIGLALPLCGVALTSLVALSATVAILAFEWERASPAASGFFWLAFYALAQALTLTAAGALGARALAAHVAAARAPTS